MFANNNKLLKLDIFHLNTHGYCGRTRGDAEQTLTFNDITSVSVLLVVPTRDRASWFARTNLDEETLTPRMHRARLRNVPPSVGG